MSRNIPGARGCNTLAGVKGQDPLDIPALAAKGRGSAPAIMP